MSDLLLLFFGNAILHVVPASWLGLVLLESHHRGGDYSWL